jgi:sulfur-carrier protein adenylyltransferase/sulfurtransferase
MFTQQESVRYARHFVLPGFGPEGQERLKNGRVLVVGAGGLGSPLLQYLAAAGVGRIGIVDADTVDISNLQRQVLYKTDDLGEPKAEVARQRLCALNPHLDIRAYPVRFTRENALDLLRDYDIVADGTDNFPTRYLVNDACVLAGKINVFASVFRFEGQVAVFNLPDPGGERGVQYRDLYPAPPPPGLVPDCAEGGVLGVLPGIIGAIQALEVIKVLAGVGEPLAGRLLVMDSANMLTRVLKIKKNPDLIPPAELIDYEIFCGVSPADAASSVRGITPAVFREWQASGVDFQLVDVREPHERALSSLGGLFIPLGLLSDHTDLIARDKPVVLHCQSGKRSARAFRLLEQSGFQNLYNLEGGMTAFEPGF